MRLGALVAVAVLVAGSLGAQIRDDTGADGAFLPDRPASGTLGALNAAVSVRVSGRPGVGAFISTANLNATVVAEVSSDAGTTWRSAEFIQPDGTVATSLTFGGGSATEQRGIVLVGGVTHARVRVSAYTSGTASATVRATAAYGSAVRVVNPLPAVGTKSNNSAAPGATNLGTLPAVATAALPTYTEGNQVALSTDLTGALRTTATGAFTADSELPPATTLTENHANPTAPAVGAFNMVFDGANWDRWTGAVTQSGAWSTTVTSGTVTTNQGTNPWGVSISQIGANNDVDVLTFPDNEPFNWAQLAGTALAAPFDADTGAGTQNLQGVILRKAASGGSVELGTSTDPVRTDPTGTTTQPVSGTVTANQGGAPWSVAGPAADGAAVSGNPVRIAGKDGSGNTQDIITDAAGELQVDVLTLPNVTIGAALPTGDNTIGRLKITDGSEVVEVWNFAANDALSVAIVDAAGNQITSFGGGTEFDEDSAHVSGHKGTQILGVRQDAAGTLCGTDGDYCPIQVDASGNLRVNVAAGGGSGGTSSSFGAAFPGTGTAIGFSDGTNMQGGRVVDADTGAGTVWVQGVNLLKRASGGPVEAGTSGDPLRVDPTGTTTQPVSAASLPLPTGASTLAEQQTQTTALQLIDDVVHATNAALGKAAAIAGQLDDVSPTAATENNVAPVRISANRSLWTITKEGPGTSQADPFFVEPANLIPTNPFKVVETNGSGSVWPRKQLDYDSGAGTDDMTSYPIGAAASGGLVAIEGTAANGLEVDVTRVQGSVTVVGNKSDDAAAPGSDNLGVLNSVATAANPSSTEGRMVVLSQDLAGNTRVRSGVGADQTATWTSATAANTAITLTSVLAGTIMASVIITGGSPTGCDIIFEMSPDAGTTWIQARGVAFYGAAATYPATSDRFDCDGGYTQSAAELSTAAWGPNAQFRLRLNPAITGAGNVAVRIQNTSASGNIMTFPFSREETNPWACSLDNIGNTLTQCQSAAAAGTRYYLTDISIGSTTATAGQFLVRTGTGTNCGTGTASLYPSAATAVRYAYPGNTSANGPAHIQFKTPLRAPLATAICILCVATNTCTVQMSGFQAP